VKKKVRLERDRHIEGDTVRETHLRGKNSYKSLREKEEKKKSM